MPRRHRFIYTRAEGGKVFRGFAPRLEIERIVRTGLHLGVHVAFIRGSTWNFDFVLERPRIDGREISISELWYRAEWEKVDPQNLTVNPVNPVNP